MIYLQCAILAVMFVFSACVVAKERFCLNCQRDVGRLFFYASFGTYAMARVYCLLKYSPEVLWWLVAIEFLVAIIICIRFMKKMIVSNKRICDMTK